jgi:CRISPR-associated protein Cst1
MSQNPIILYPSNWLYNAGVVGLLIARENAGENVEQDLREDGSCTISTDYFEQGQFQEIPRAIANLVHAIVSDEDLRSWLEAQEKSGKEKGKHIAFDQRLGDFGPRFVRAGNKLFASNAPYQNLVQLGEWRSYEYARLVRNIPELLGVRSGRLCNLCGQRDVFVANPASKLEQRLSRLGAGHLTGLGPSSGEFPNGFWALQESLGVCHLCSFLILHHHLAFVQLSDKSKVFINAPSFRLAYHLSRFVRTCFGDALSKEQAQDKRHILAMSLIEYATKIETSLGVWTGMNIEIVSKHGDKMQFFSLPPEVVRLLSDRRIASLLSQIGEFVILNCVLDQDFSRLMETGYRLLRIGLKNAEWGKAERDFVNHTVRLERNRRNPAQTAEKIFKLCALIEEKTKRRHEYEWRSD